MSNPRPAIPEDTILLCVDMQPKFVAAVADGIRIWEEGADYYLGKPVMYDDFVATLAEAGVSLP